MIELSPAEQAVYGRIYPLIEQIEEELQAGIVLLLWVNLARMLASRGIELGRLQELLVEHYDHQTKFNVSRTH